MCVNVELHYWELELELVSNQYLSLPNSDLSLPNWAVIVLYFRHCTQSYRHLIFCYTNKSSDYSI